MNRITKIVCFLWISAVSEISTFSNKDNCVPGCQCSIFDISQTLLAHWENNTHKIKTAMCIGNGDTFLNTSQLPRDTEMFTFIQPSNNMTLTIQKEDLSGLDNTWSIDIQGSLPYLKTTQNAFESVPLLKYLFLRNIDFSNMDKALYTLKNLKVLQVSSSHIDLLKWELFEGLTSLKDLSLIDCGIKMIARFAFYGAPDLRKLVLSHNQLFSLEADSFSGVSKLEELDLSGNRLRYISSSSFPSLPKLQRLDLKHNPIKIIFPHSFQFLENIQHLTLGHKHEAIHLLKFTFRGLISLKFLHIPNIENDVLTEHMFFDLKSLVHLNLEGKIKTINNRAFSHLHNSLQKLKLKNCALQKLMDHAFNGLEKLLILDLSSNKLRYLTFSTLEPLQSLQELLLYDNQITRLPQQIFMNLPSLQNLRLDMNPWNCTCDMTSWKMELVEFSDVSYNMTKENATDIDALHAKDSNAFPACSTPSLYKNKNVFFIVKTELECRND